MDAQTVFQLGPQMIYSARRFGLAVGALLRASVVRASVAGGATLGPCEAAHLAAHSKRQMSNAEWALNTIAGGRRKE